MKKNYSYLKFLSTATVILLTTQSYALAGNIKIVSNKKNPTLLAQATQQTPNSNSDVLIPNPTILIDGKPATPSQPSAPPYLPRAVAPPVGDMAISNIENTTPNLIKFDNNATIPRLVLKDSPVREILSILARYGGYNLIFTGSEAESAEANSTISLELENEQVEDVFNWILMVSGLNAGKKGNTIFVGADLPFAARNIISRSIRLNQYSVPAVAQFLGSQGASVKVVDAEVEEGEGNKATTVTYETKEIYLEESKGEKLILRGLTVHGDEQNGQIVLVGPPHLVEIATNFITQLDVRRRQVALNVKIMVVSLDNEQSLGTEWLFGNSDYRVNIGAEGLVASFLDGGFINTQFEAILRAKIASNNAKILSDPTLIIQEGQRSLVKLTDKVLTSVTTQYVQISDNQTQAVTTPVFSDAGLTLGVRVDKIDDNGFVSVVVVPELSAPTDSIFYQSEGGTNRLTLLSQRTVSSGLIRLRDGQSLLLSGIIQDSQVSSVNKVPILGDLPLLGFLFRNDTNTNTRNELVVLVTPQILDDSQPYNGKGYTYTPSPEIKKSIEEQGLTIPNQP